MATAPSPVSLEDYLHMSYSPDCEYVDGLILERNVGQGKHSFTQGKILRRLADLLEAKGLLVLPEQRTRVSPNRVRVPDVSVVSKLEEVTSDPPLLCVEVLSPDDRWSRVMASISDYQSMEVAQAATPRRQTKAETSADLGAGRESVVRRSSSKIPCVWVVDPYRRAAWIFDQEQPPAQIGSDGFLRAESLGVELLLAEVLPPAEA